MYFLLYLSFDTGSYTILHDGLKLILACSLGWPQTDGNPPTSVSQVLELEVCTTRVSIGLSDTTGTGTALLFHTVLPNRKLSCFCSAHFSEVHGFVPLNAAM